MDPYSIAPLKLRCGAREYIAGTQWQCLRFAHHDGFHASEPGPGETVAWPGSSTSANEARIVNDHIANGQVVAQVRQWLDILDNTAEDYGNVKTLSRLINYSGYGCELTVDHVRTLLAEHDAYRTKARKVCAMSRPESTYRCGFQIEHSLSLLPDRPGAYRVSKGGQSNIIGERFFDEINGDSDHAFEEFMTAALRPDFPHPFAMEE